MEEDQNNEEPTEEDFVGQNGAYAQSIAILHKGLNDSGRKLDKIRFNAGGGVDVVGRFPSFVISKPNQRRPRQSTDAKELDWPLKVHFTSDGKIRFTPSEVMTWGNVPRADGKPSLCDTPMMPHIGGTPIDADPSPTLPFQANGGICCMKHTYTWMGESVSGNNHLAGDVLTTDVEIVQFPLNAVSPPVRLVSLNNGQTEVAGNISYKMFSAYSGTKKIIVDSISGPDTEQIRTVEQLTLCAKLNYNAVN